MSGTGDIFRRNKIYWIDFSYRGKRIRESSGSTRKADAADYLLKRRNEVSKGRIVGQTAARITVRDLEEAVRTDYLLMKRKSLKRLGTSFRHVGRLIGVDTPALDITEDLLRDYVVTRQGEGASDSSIQKELAALKRGFTLKSSLLTKPAFPTISPNNVREGFFTHDEIEAICMRLTAPIAVVLRFAFYIGWRKGEILGLRWSDVRWGDGIIRLEPGTTKNGEGREFPFADFAELLDLVEKQRQHTNDVERKRGTPVEYLFHRNGKPIRDFSVAWRKALDQAGLRGRWFHDTRRSAVRNLEAAGVPRSVAMKLTGHKTESIYRRYAISDQHALADGVAKLAAYHHQYSGAIVAGRRSE